MSLYQFDILEGEGSFKDEHGIALPTDLAAIQEAMSLLGALAKDARLPSAESGPVVTVVVRQGSRSVARLSANVTLE